MRILHITDGIPPETLGGTGRIVWETATMQAALGHEVAILTATTKIPRASLWDSNIAVPQKKESNVTVFAIPVGSERFAHYRSVFSGRRAKEVARIIDEVKPDVIHAHTISRQCGYRWIPQAKKRGIAVVHTAHDVADVAYGKVTGFETSLWFRDFKRATWTWNPFRTSMIRWYLMQCDAVLTVSDALKSYLERFGYTNLRTLHNGINLDFWRESISMSEARSELKFPSDDTLFLFAGRLGHDKGTILINDTFPKHAHLVIAGEVNPKQLSSLSDRLTILPPQSAEAMRTLYAACDAALVPSRCLDCFPTVCLEVMAMGRAVVASSWGGAKESVTDGETGWIIDPLDEDAWRRQLQWCVDRRETLSEFGERGRRRVENHFSLKNNVEALIDVYEHALKAPAAS